MGTLNGSEVDEVELEGPEDQTTADAEPSMAAVSRVVPTLLCLY